jgi:hypothetical protein
MSIANAHGMVSKQPRVERFIEMVRTEYRDLPGLHLTRPQMRRFLDVDVRTCDVVLEALERQKFLKRTPEDAYVLEP